MNAQSNTKKALFLTLSSLILITLCLLEGVRSSLHNLEGEYLSERIPIMGGYPPNDFLLWGVLTFFILGLTIVNFSIKKADDRSAKYKAILMLSIVTFAMNILGDLLTYREGLIWRNEASGLILVWTIACWAGAIWSYAYRQVKTLFDKPGSGM